jgi:hypothetical protein
MQRREKAMSRIFISYRRQDSATMTGRIYDKLETALGSNRVFRDIDDISAGEDFRAKLAKEIDKSDILLVIIGPKWEGITDNNGNRRLDDPNDFVRLEVEAGLKRTDKIVIPVLVENAAMPKPESLPESLRELCYRNAVNVRQDPDFHRDLQKLINEIQNITATGEPLYKKRPVMIGAGLLVVGLAAILLASFFKSTPPATIDITETISVPATNTITVQNSSTPNQQSVLITDTAVPTQATETNTPAPIRPIRIGIIQIPDYIFTDVRERLQSLGFDAEWINLSSDYSAFSQYDVIYLPIGWAFQKDLIESRALQYQRFVEEGGGLVVEQPNYAGTFTPNLLPYKITFKTFVYDPDEWPPHILVEHEIVNGISLSELPGPGNQITARDDNWTIITTSSKSNYPTLVAGSYGRGRIVVIATSASKNSLVRYSIGDNFIKNFITWVNQ